jgi:acyl carrier protein
MGLDSVEIVMEAERLFNVELPDALVERVYTFGEFVDCVEKACRAKGYTLGGNEIETSLRRAVSEQLGVREEDILPESRLVQDLGMN